jgi:hypothetical protein
MDGDELEKELIAAGGRKRAQEDELGTALASLVQSGFWTISHADQGRAQLPQFVRQLCIAPQRRHQYIAQGSLLVVGFSHGFLK